MLTSLQQMLKDHLQKRLSQKLQIALNALSFSHFILFEVEDLGVK